MAIQQIDLAVPNGDTVRSANVKINENFSNTAHAASKLIGTEKGQIALTEDLFAAIYSKTALSSSLANPDEDTGGERTVNGNAPTPPAAGIFVYTAEATTSDRVVQRAYDMLNGFEYLRGRRTTSGTWTEWRPSTSHQENYRMTTQANPNVAVTSDGTLMRSTSSMKYKELIKHLELSAEDYANAMRVNPIVYRSKCDPDPENWHYLSFSAEELGEYDPALTFWQTHETDPETGEQVELEQKEAEGINLNAICAVLHATNIYQDKKLKELEQRLTALESNIEPIK